MNRPVDALPESANGDALLRVEDLSVTVRRGPAAARIVQDVSFSLRRGGVLGLVGESGCGKTTLSRAILGLIPASGGRVWFDGRDLLSLPRGELRRLRPRVQMIFQDPAGSLNPRLDVETIVGEALTVHGLARGRRARAAAVAEMLQRVGLAADDARKYPHEFSGGQRQRIAIARALVLRPTLVICDEPVSALDVSLRAQILNLLGDLRRDYALSYIFIAHDLLAVRHVCDEAAVMYAGAIVEHAPAGELFGTPRHPYTRLLLNSAPRLNAEPSLTSSASEPPDVFSPPSGCAFHPRCPLAVDRCRVERPMLEAHPGLAAGHLVACHRASEGS